MTKTIIYNKQLNKVSATLKWLILQITAIPETRKRYSQISLYWVGTIDAYVARQGIQWTCDHFKEVRAITIAYLAGTPRRTAKRFISINASGLPKVLRPLMDLARSKDETDIKFLLTLLKVTKSLRTEPRPNLLPITTPPSGVVGVIPQEALQAFFDSIGIKRGSLIPHWTEYNLSTKSSPNRKPATSAALEELRLIRDEFPLLLADLKILGGKTLAHYLEILCQTNLPQGAKLIRRLIPLSDKEGKTRLAAILDYWTQTSLLPLHNSIMSTLKRFQADMTFNQEIFASRDMTGPYYCYDLKDATDRFPISFQKQVVEYITSKEYAEAWTRALTQWPFDLNGESHLYRCGQPMGAYSSWAAFSLCHHFVVQWAAMRCNKHPFRNYWLLGDDIVIRDRDVALVYSEIMNGLGVEFSPTKTLISPNFCEFASRHFRDGKEVTGFSVVGLQEMQNIPQLVEFLRTMTRHGWDFPRGSPPGLLSSLAKVTGIKHRLTPDQLRILWLFPFKDILACKPSPSQAELLQYLSCHGHGAALLREQLLTIVAQKLEKEIEFCTMQTVSWASALSHIHMDLLKDSGIDAPPFSPSVIPILGAWHTLRTITRERVNQIFREKTSHDTYDLDWIGSIPLLNMLPNVSRATSQRRSVIILQTNASLILKAWSRAKAGSRGFSFLSDL